MKARKLFTRPTMPVGLMLLSLQGCMPTIMHSPRIDPGLTTGLVASYTAGPRRGRYDAGDVAFAYGPVGVNVGYGWTSDRIEGLGVRLGAHVPVPLVIAAQPDVYIQLPRRVVVGLDAGVGIASVPAHATVVPYAQVGALRASGSGLYATYGFLIGPDPMNANYSGRDSGADLPGIAFQRVNGRTTTRFFVTGIISRNRRCPDGVSDCVRKDNWAVAGGMAIERRGRARR